MLAQSRSKAYLGKVKCNLFETPCDAVAFQSGCAVCEILDHTQATQLRVLAMCNKNTNTTI